MKNKAIIILGILFVLIGCYMLVSSNSKIVGQYLMMIGLLLELYFFISIFIEKMKK